MKNENFLLFIDSGLGGISILKNFLSVKNNNINVIYYADTKNFPYGEKDEKTIGRILLNIYEKIKLRFNISMIIIACNTASVSAIKILRDKVNLPIIGTVPAVKPAAAITKNNKIGIIATETTARGSYLTDLVSKFASFIEVRIKGSNKLVEASENIYSGDKLKKVIDEELSDLKNFGIDTLVLGCTHYSFLAPEINEFFESKVNIIDSVSGVTKRIIQLMPEENSLAGNRRVLYLSSSDKDIKNKYKNFNDKYKIFNEIFSGEEICRKV